MNLKLFKGKILRAWKDIEGYEGLYQVSTDGRVRSIDRYIKYKNGKIRFIKGNLIKCKLNNRDYLIISLSKNSKQKTYLIHRLVAEAFIPNPNNKPCVDHIIPLSQGGTNEVTNLRWVTHKENNNNPLTIKNREELYKNRTGKNNPMYGRTGSKNPNARAVWCEELQKSWSTVKECSDELGISSQALCNHLKGKTNSCCKLHFKYKNRG